jgi:hypothetical protein
VYTRSFVLAVFCIPFAATAQASQLYMSAGNSIYEFNGSGQLITSVSDPNNVLFQGLVVGPDSRLYVGVSNGVSRVDSFSLNLSNHVTGYVANTQGGLALPIGAAFLPDGNLYVAAENNGRVMRYYGPNSVSPAPGSNFPSGVNTGANWSSGVAGPTGLALAPDGTLYGSAQTGGGTIYRYDTTTGAATSVATNIFSESIEQLTINAVGTSLFVRDAGKVFEFTINPDHSLTGVPFAVTYPAGGNDLGSYAGLTFGPDGMLYAATRTFPNGNPNPNFNTDYVVRIDPSTGVASTFVAGPINLNGGQNPTLLLFTSVPEPGSLTIGVFGLAVGMFARAKRRQTRANPFQLSPVFRTYSGGAHRNHDGRV